MKILPTDVLLRIDIQNDFIPGGALAVPGGDEIIEDVNRLSQAFHEAGALIVDSQDWHPAIHKSFASNHPGKAPFDTMPMPYGEQVLWPDHCIQGLFGAEFHTDLTTDFAAMVVRKGMNPEIDSYSAFFENDKLTPTGLGGALSAKKIRRVFLVGLAYDFCVGYSALDAIRLPMCPDVYVVKDLTRAIDLNGSVAAIEDLFAAYKVNVITSADIDDLPVVTNTGPDDLSPFSDRWAIRGE